MIQEILNSIDQIDDITTEYTVSTMNSMIDSYEKSTLILENYEGDDLSSFSIFQEGEIMDDVKKQGKGQSTLMKILSFIPRLIKAIFHKIKKAIGKGETPAAVNKELQKEPKEVKKALPILFDNKKDKKSKVSMIKKILIGAGAVGAAAVVGKKTMSKSKNDSDGSSNPISEMIGLLTNLKNALKRKSETEEKLEEAEKEQSSSDPKGNDKKGSKNEIPQNPKGNDKKENKNEIPQNPKGNDKKENKNEIPQNPKGNDKKENKNEIPQIPRELPVNNNQSVVNKLEQQLKKEKQEIERIKIKAFKLLPAIIDNSISEESQKILNNLDKIEEKEEKISELIATLKNYESKKDEYYKDLDKEISKLIEICESKHKSLVSIYTTINNCCHRMIDKMPCKPTDEFPINELKQADKVVKLLESGDFKLLKISKDGEEISLSENIDNNLTHAVSFINFTMYDILVDIRSTSNRGYKFDDSNAEFAKRISSNTGFIIMDTKFSQYLSNKMIIDPSKKTARSSEDYRNPHSVFDNSLVRKSDLETIETYFTEIKGLVEEINKERPEEIKERNIAGVMIYVSTLVELANHLFAFACGATNLVKELVGRVSEINKKYEGERNKLFNNKSE